MQLTSQRLSAPCARPSATRPARSLCVVQAQASANRKEVAPLQRAGAALLAAAAAAQLGMGGPAFAAIGGASTPYGPKPDSGREVTDKYNEQSGGPATKGAYDKRAQLGGQQAPGPMGSGTKPTEESVNK
ncbi:hypothetical protein WJX73_005095 [Symbiochloris irregularis]|uniref:Uncharacterized protein n=1 Tax=Symbiochloris irregularis TaxID=706552 RepID=A0AAW1NED2_9CHLO